MLTTLIMVNNRIPVSPETHSEYMKRRLTDAAQRELFPQDRGLEHVAETPTKRVRWGENEVVIENKSKKDTP